MDKPSLTPKLVCAGADAAIEFYRRAFGAELRQRYTAGDRVVFAELELFGSALQVKDADEFDPSPTSLGRPGVLMTVTHDDPDAVAASAVEAGATVVFPVGDQAYGARGGRVRDPFGHEWLVQTPVMLSASEVQAALDGEPASDPRGSN